jgi:hypothetical protein
MTEEQVNNSYARKSLAAQTVENMPTYCGVPVEFLTKEEVIKVLVSAMKDLEREQNLHRGTLSIMGARHG